ncbi:hypothetical protein G7Z17_g1337 [Cylindrodendrum hubeiense]|uniref:Zn(2)-C6 fungal-type domain-containing protein n=1 Tax=Cylindrodendrum hubeiense TaxID=595255 RepID=A0A9P5HLQ6_9HYPO|nr:hypothetical protein G7Z17_g1337 [Cylindrodendrum hubeiense]
MAHVGLLFRVWKLIFVQERGDKRRKGWAWTSASEPWPPARQAFIKNVKSVKSVQSIESVKSIQSINFTRLNYSHIPPPAMSPIMARQSPSVRTHHTSRKKFATPPVKSACTSCGHSPCNRCLKKDQICVFTESRRGLKPEPTHPARRSSRIVENSKPSQESPCPQDTILGIDDTVFTPDQQGVLPSLYNDDLNMIQFDDIFGGDSDEALDNFFADVFSLPAYPPVAIIDESVVDIPPPQHIPVLRRYKSDEEVISAYYELIHPGFPILPPPPEQDVEDHAEPWVPTGQFFSDYEPSSPLILAMLSILVLLPHSNDENPSDETGQELRAGYAQSLAQCAIECIGIASGMDTPGLPSFSRPPVHPNVPIELETPMAFCVLSVYQYLHHGNIGKMIQMAEGAFDSSTRLSLHKQDRDDSPFSEARRRTWWITATELNSLAGVKG